MQVRVLGCSGGIGAGLLTTAFLVDDDVLIDAGTGVGDLSYEDIRGSVMSSLRTRTSTTSPVSPCWSIRCSMT
jgi:hypothetical protein